MQSPPKIIPSPQKISKKATLDVQKDHFARLRRCLDDRLAAFEILCGKEV